MQPPSTTPTIGEARSREQGHGYGMVLFASILLIVIGCFNLVHGIRPSWPRSPAPGRRAGHAAPVAARQGRS